MKAWMVYDPDSDSDFTAEIVRADTRGYARFHNMLVSECDVDPMDLQVTRCPKPDGDFEITDKHLIEVAEFWMPCIRCDTLIDSDSEGRVYSESDDVVWCKECAAKRMEVPHVNQDTD